MDTTEQTVWVVVYRFDDGTTTTSVHSTEARARAAIASDQADYEEPIVECDDNTWDTDGMSWALDQCIVDHGSLDTIR